MYYFPRSLIFQFSLLPIPSPLKFLQQLLSRSSKITVNDNTRNLIESNLIFPIDSYNFLVYRRCMCVTKYKFGTDSTSESIHNEPYSFPVAPVQHLTLERDQLLRTGIFLPFLLFRMWVGRQIIPGMYLATADTTALPFGNWHSKFLNHSPAVTRRDD